MDTKNKCAEGGGGEAANIFSVQNNLWRAKLVIYNIFSDFAEEGVLVIGQATKE